MYIRLQMFFTNSFSSTHFGLYQFEHKFKNVAYQVCLLNCVTY